MSGDLRIRLLFSLLLCVECFAACEGPIQNKLESEAGSNPGCSSNGKSGEKNPNCTDGVSPSEIGNLRLRIVGPSIAYRGVCAKYFVFLETKDGELMPAPSDLILKVDTSGGELYSEKSPCSDMTESIGMAKGEVVARVLYKSGLLGNFQLRVASKSAISTLSLAVRDPGQSGTLDQSFNSNGKITLPLGDLAEARSIKTLPDGSTVFAGYFSKDTSCVFVAKVDSAGTFDPTFGDHGLVIQFSPVEARTGMALAVQEDGNIIVGGFVSDDERTRYGFLLTRFLKNGQLDTTFNGSGWVATEISEGQDQVHALAIQPDGKIVAAGNSNTGKDFAMARYNRNGSIDQSFGKSGVVITSIPGFNILAEGVAVLPNGNIVLSGYGYNRNYFSTVVLAEYGSDGSLNDSFGIHGIVQTPVGLRGGMSVGLAVQPDGKLVVAGLSNDGFGHPYRLAALRYLPSGALDPSFGTAGITTVGSNNIDSVARSLTLQPDGKIVVVGYKGSQNSSFSVLRLNSNGTLDQGFGQGGISENKFSSSLDIPQAVDIQPDGKVVVVGLYSRVDSDGSGAAILRLWP